MRTIDADELKKAINDNGCRHSHYFDIFDIIDNAPTVEQPTGEEDGTANSSNIAIWIGNRFDEHYCSSCGHAALWEESQDENYYEMRSNYCPNCGKKMEGGEGE